MREMEHSRLRSIGLRLEVIACTCVLLVMILWPWAAAAQQSPSASPAAGCSDMRMSNASQVASPSATITTASQNRTNVVLAYDNFISCRNAQAWGTLVDLMQPEFRLEQFGAGQAEPAAAAMAALNAAGFYGGLSQGSAGEPSVSSGFASLAVTTQEGYVQRREEWHFRLSDDRWLVSDLIPLPPLLSVNAVGIPLTLDETGLRTTRTSLNNPGAIVLDLVNTTDQEVSFVVIRSPNGAGTSGLLRDLNSGPVDSALVIGWMVVSAGETRGLALVDLPNGTYSVVAGYDPRLAIQQLQREEIIHIAIQR